MYYVTVKIITKLNIMNQRDIDDVNKGIERSVDNILQLSENLQSKPSDLIDLDEELNLFLSNFLNKKMAKLANDIKEHK